MHNNNNTDGMQLTIAFADDNYQRKSKERCSVVIDINYRETQKREAIDREIILRTKSW